MGRLRLSKEEKSGIRSTKEARKQACKDISSLEKTCYVYHESLVFQACEFDINSIIRM